MVVRLCAARRFPLSVRAVTAGAALAAAAALLAGALAPAGSARPTRRSSASDNVLPTIYVSYTMNCTFGITDDSGKPVTSIAPGTYQVQITTPKVFADVDLSGTYDMTACKSFVQFQLTGPGVNISTTLQEGDEDYGVFPATFAPGSSYTAVDLNQPSVARVAFATLVGSVPVDPVGPGTGGSGKTSTSKTIIGSTSSTNVSTTVSRGTLAATVNAAGAVTFTTKGKAVSTLKSGRYTVVVSDKSKKSGFVLQEIHKLATSVSSGAFVGKRSISVVLKPGQWFFYPTFIARKTYFLVTN